MSTTISPSLGAGLLYTQGGVGASPGFAAIDDRRAASIGLQEGVYAAGSFEVTQRGAGANLSVDIAASTHENGIAALVQGDSVTAQGLYAVGPHSAVINEAIAAAHATLPRVDRVVLEIQDNLHDASGANAARTRVITGTATSGATLTNLTGAAAVPNNCLLLADVLVAATDTAIGNTEIRDRRKWARGANLLITRTAGAYTTASTSLASIDATNLKPRIECSGVPVRCILWGTAQSVTTAGQVKGELRLDGVAQTQRFHRFPVNDIFDDLFFAATIIPAAGSHTFEWVWATSTPTISLNASATDVLMMSVEEIVRPSAANNATTSG